MYLRIYKTINPQPYEDTMSKQHPDTIADIAKNLELEAKEVATFKLATELEAAMNPGMEAEFTKLLQENPTLVAELFKDSPSLKAMINSAEFKTFLKIAEAELTSAQISEITKANTHDLDSVTHHLSATNISTGHETTTILPAIVITNADTTPLVSTTTIPSVDITDAPVPAMGDTNNKDADAE
jgi:hypothetical protein